MLAPASPPPKKGGIMNLHRTLIKVVMASTLSFLALGAMAQAPQRPPYGQAINLETAKKMALASAAEAKKNNWNVAIAIVDNHGFLVYYEMMDDTQTGSATVAVDKARSAAMFRRPSKEFEENVTAGRVAILGLSGATPIEGGLPIVVSGKMIGAIGVSGVTSAQDGQIAKAGIEALAK
jgi:glc operon protein GlcG